MSQRGRAAYPRPKDTHILPFPWAIVLGVTHRGARRLTHAQILRLGRDTEVTT